MDRYVGLDGHAHSCTLGVLGPSGKRLKSMVVETNGRVLVDTLKSIPGRVHLCMEEGELSGWLYELLAPHVAELVVAVPHSTRGRPKDDLRDAFARAEEVRIGAVTTRVYKAPPHLSGLKNAVRAYGMAVTDLSRVKNRLKAVCRSRGVLADHSLYDPESRAKWLQQLPNSYRQLAQWLGEELDRLEPLVEKAETWLLEEAKTHPIIRTLQTAPGMGPIRTAQLVAIAANPDRFRTSRQFWSYCGLSIVTRSSSDWRQDKTGRWLRAQVPQTRGLTRKRHPLLKAVFKGAATTVITRMPTHPLHADYQRALAAGTKPNLAKLTLARRIAAIVLSMWKHKEVYDPQRHMAVRHKAE
jgi:transposase